MNDVGPSKIMMIGHPSGVQNSNLIFFSFHIYSVVLMEHTQLYRIQLYALEHLKKETDHPVE